MLNVKLSPDKLLLASGTNCTEWPLFRNFPLLNGGYETTRGSSEESRFTSLSIKSMGDCRFPMNAIGQLLYQLAGPVDNKCKIQSNSLQAEF